MQAMKKSAALLEKIVEGKDLLNLRMGEKLFSQGAEANALYFIQTGKVQLTVVSPQGKEAILATLYPGDFLGEECLVDNSLRTSTATSAEPSTAFRIEKRAMLEALHILPGFSEQFVAALLARNVILEEDLCDQLFNHTEKRLARILLKLARFGQDDKLLATKVPRLTHKAMAELVGTTSSEVSLFMNKFRMLGLIDDNGDGDIIVRAGLLTEVVLQD
jgi:CRP/FNR family transcriptional regulator, cyclic AMP receptor protein